MEKTIKGLMVAILAFGLLFALAGCGKEKEAEETVPPESSDSTPPADVTPAPAPEPVDEMAFTINGLEFRLDAEKTFEGLSYITSARFAEAVHELHIPYVQYNFYQTDNTNLLYFRIFHYKGQGDADAIKDLGLEGQVTFTDFKTDSLEFRFYAQPRDDGGTIHFYFLSKDGDTYVLSFISLYDIQEFESKTLQTVHF